MPPGLPGGMFAFVLRNSIVALQGEYMSASSLVVIGLGVLLVIFGGIVLIWFPTRQGGTVKAVNVEVSAPGAGLVLMVVGAAAAIFGATQMGGLPSAPTASGAPTAVSIPPTSARTSPVAAAPSASTAARPSAVAQTATSAARPVVAGATAANGPALAFVPLANPVATPLAVKPFGP